MPTPLTDADKVLRNDTGKDIVEKLDDIAQALGVGVNADQINYDNTESGLTADDVQEAIDELHDNTIYETTATPGSIVSFSDGEDNVSVKSLITNITAVQSGTGIPSPTNVRSISGFSNVNIANMSDITNLTYFKGLLKGTHGFVDLGTKNWTYTSASGAGGGYFSTYLTGRKLGAIYDHMICSKYEIESIRGYSNIPSTTDKVIFCSNNNTQTVISIIDSSYTDETTFTNAMSGVYIIYELETPTTPTITVEQFNTLLAHFNIGGCLVKIALGQIVYGGYLNVLSGVLTITHAYYDLANYTGTITKVTTGGIADKSYFRFDDLSPYPLITNGELICDKFEKVTITTSTTDKGVGLGSPSALGHSTVYFRPENPNDYTTSTIMNYIQNTLGSLIIVYKLQEADYITVQLSSNQILTLLGQNYIYADCGDITELIYFNNKSDNLVDLIQNASEAQHTRFDNTTYPVLTNDIQSTIDTIYGAIKDFVTVSSASGSIVLFNTDLEENLTKCIATIDADTTGFSTCNVHLMDNGKLPSDTIIHNRYIATNDRWTTSTDSRSIAIPIGKNTEYTITGYSTQTTIFRIGVLHGDLPESSSNYATCYNVERYTSYADIGKSFTYTTDSSATYLIIQLNASLIEDFVANGYVAPSTSISVSLGETVTSGALLDILAGKLIFDIPSDIHVYSRWINQTTEKWAGSTTSRTIAIPCLPLTEYTITGYNSGYSAYKFATIREETLPNDDQTQYDIYQIAYFTSYAEVGKSYTFTTDASATYIIIQQGVEGMTYLINNGSVAKTVTSNQIKTNIGTNQICADTGDIEIKYLETVANKLT